MTLGLVLTPRRPRGAGGGEEQAGEARCPSPPQTLSLREKSAVKGIVLLDWLPPDHLGIGRKSRQFLPAQASCRDPGTSSLLKKVFEVSRSATLIQDPSARRTKDSQPSGFGFECCASPVRFRVFQQTARGNASRTPSRDRPMTTKAALAHAPPFP